MANNPRIDIGVRVGYKEVLEQMKSDFKKELTEISNHARKTSFDADIEKKLKQIDDKVDSTFGNFEKRFQDISNQTISTENFEKYQLKVSKSFSELKASISDITDQIADLNQKVGLLDGADTASKMKTQFDDWCQSILKTNEELKKALDITRTIGDNPSSRLSDSLVKDYKETLEVIKRVRKETDEVTFDDISDDSLNSGLETHYKFLLENIEAYKQLRQEVAHMSKEDAGYSGKLNELKRYSALMYKEYDALTRLDAIRADRTEVDDSKYSKLADTLDRVFKMSSMDSSLEEWESNIKKILQKSKEASEQIQGTFDTFRVKDGAIHIPIDIATKSSDLKNKISDIIQELKTYAENTPVIAKVKLTLDKSSSKGYEKNSEVDKQQIEGQNEPAVDITKAIQKTYRDAAREAKQIVKTEIKKIQEEFENVPIKIKPDTDAFTKDLKQMINTSFKAITEETSGVKVNEELEKLVSNLKEVSSSLSGNENFKLGIDEDSINRITDAIQNMADMIQRAFGVASNDDIVAQWSVIEGKFKTVAGEEGKLLKGNKEHKAAIQELAIEYKKYLDMGGKNDLSNLTAHKQTVKNITTEYEKLNTEVKETQDVLDNKGNTGAISHAEDQINKENKAIDDQISKVSKLIKGWKELNTEHALFFNSKTGINSGDISSSESQYISIKDDLFKGKGYDSIIHNHPKDFTESGLAFSDSDLLGLVEKAFKEGITNILLYYQDQIMKLDISGFSEEQVRSLGNIYRSFYRDFDETAQNSVVASDIFDDVESYLKSIKETLRFALGLDKEFSVTPDSENTFESLSKELLISIEENVFASIKGLITRSPELFNEKSYISLYEEVSNLILSDVEKNLTELISKESISLDSSKFKTFIDQIKALFEMERAFVLPEDLQVGKRARMGRASSVEEMNSALNSILKAIDPSSDRLSIHSIEEIFPQSFASKVSSEEKEAINAVSRENKKLETQAGKTGVALDNEGKSAQSAAEKFRKLAKEKGAAVYANRELAKAAKETADALEREANARKSGDRKGNKNAVDEGTYESNALAWQKNIKQSLLDGGSYEEVYGGQLSRLESGVVKYTASVRDSEGAWKKLTATISSSGDIQSTKLQDLTEKQVLKIEKEKEAVAKLLEQMADEGAEPMRLSRDELERYADDVKSILKGLEKSKKATFTVNLGSDGKLSITRKEISKTGAEVKSFTAVIDNVEDVFNNTSEGMVVSARKLKEALKSAFDNGNISKSTKDLAAGAQKAFDVFKEKAVRDDNFSVIKGDLENLRQQIANIKTSKDLVKFNQDLKDLGVTLKNVGKDNKLGEILNKDRTFKDINEVRANIDSLFALMGKVDEKSIKINGTNKLTAEVKAANGEIRKMNVSLDSNGFARYVDAGIVQFGRLRSAAEGVFKGIQSMVRIYLSPQDFIRYFRQGFDKVKEIDTAMTELKKVSDAPIGDIIAYFEDATESAKELGSTVKDMISATADWSRLGYNLPDARELGEVAVLYKNVGDGIDIDTANESLVSTIQGFQLQAKDAMAVIDSFNEVSNNYAISSAGIGEALKRSAAAFNAANTDLNQAIALITAGNEIVQSPEKVGKHYANLYSNVLIIKVAISVKSQRWSRPR